MKTLAFLDVETSSLDSATGELLELAIVLWNVETRSTIRACSWLFEAKANEAEAVNGISVPLITSFGRPRTRTMHEIHHAFLADGVSAVVAWNADFDRAWLPEFHREKFMCAMEDFAYPRASSGKSLTAVALAHGVGVVDAHRALADCMTMVRLFERVSELCEHEHSETSFAVWLAQAARPRAMFEVVSPNGCKEEASAQGFRWVKGADGKKWLGMRKRLAREDVAKLPFDVREVKP